MSDRMPVVSLEQIGLLSELPQTVRYLPSSLAAVGRKVRIHRRISFALLSRASGAPASDRVLAGNACIKAAMQLGMTAVPVVTLSDLDAGQTRAFVLAENRLADLAGYDRKVLALELSELVGLDLTLDIEMTSFSAAEVDALVFEDVAADRGDVVPPSQAWATSRIGDLWLLGAHRVLCGDATNSEALKVLMGGKQARVALSDPPYNCKVQGHVTGSGHHGDFVSAPGETSDDEFTQFLTAILGKSKMN